MKEARIDEVLDSIATTTLVYLPTEPLSLSELLQASMTHKEKVCKLLFLIFYSTI